MKKILFGLFLATVVIAAACTKEKPTPAEHTFGAIEVSLAALPGTPEINIYYKNQLLGSIAPGSTLGIQPKILLDAGSKNKLEFRGKESGEVLIDTLVTIAKSKKLSFQLAYSETLGIKGFLTGDQSIDPKSVSFQLFNDLDSKIPEDADIEVHVLQADPTGSTEPTELRKFSNFPKKALAKEAFKVPILMADGTTPYSYLVRLLNKTTGEYISDDFGRMDFALSFNVPGYEGKTIIVTLKQTIARNRVFFATELTAI